MSSECLNALCFTDPRELATVIVFREDNWFSIKIKESDQDDDSLITLDREEAELFVNACSAILRQIPIPQKGAKKE